MGRSHAKIRPLTYGLGLYFLLVSLDCFSLGALGSVLRFVAIIPFALQLWEIRNMRLRVNGLLIFHILFLILALTSVLYSLNQSRTIRSVVTLGLNYALILSLGLMHSYQEEEVRFLKRALLWSSWITVILMFCFSDYSLGGRLSLKLSAAEQDQNYINGYFIYAFSYHCDQYFQQKKRRHLVLALILVSIVLMTGSRGALAGYIVTALVHILLFLKDTRHFVRNILITCIACALTLVVLNLVLQSLPQNVAMRFTLDYLMKKGTIGRSRTWRILLNHFKQDPFFRLLFGHGYGTSAFVAETKGYTAHNLYLDNLITLGITGLLLQLATQATVLKMQLRQKDWTLLGCYLGLMGMCMSLSLVAYKPIWNMVLITSICAYQRPALSGRSVDTPETARTINKEEIQHE